MKFYYLIVTDILDKNKNIISSAHDLFLKRLSEKKWPLYRFTQVTNTYSLNDKLLIYLAGKSKFSQHFVATADVGEGGYKKSDLHYDENSEKKIVKGYIPLKNINLLHLPVSVRDNLNKLEFINLPKRWGMYFQGGIRKIDESNFAQILNLSKL
jgi:hypothetical protein